MDHEDLDVVSDFLVMAATLLDIKSRMLLPKVEKEEEEDEEDPRAELVRRLLEYKMYKYMAQELEEREQEAELLFFKEPTIPRVKLIGIPLHDRVKHFLQLCQRQPLQKLVQIQRFFIFRHLPGTPSF